MRGLGLVMVAVVLGGLGYLRFLVIFIGFGFFECFGCFGHCFLGVMLFCCLGIVVDIVGVAVVVVGMESGSMLGC